MGKVKFFKITFSTIMIRSLSARFWTVFRSRLTAGFTAVVKGVPGCTTQFSPMSSFLLNRKELRPLLGTKEKLLELDKVSARGYKVKVHPRLRCEYCYFIRIRGRKHVECKKFPRHKQKEPLKSIMLW